MSEAALSDRDRQKQAAAEAAVALVESGMFVGLGTGTTAAFAIAALGRRVRDGLRIAAIATSERSASQARELGIPLTSFAEHQRLDLTIDGADEVARDSLDLIKGHGGALLREKIVASASARLVIIADASKLVDRLGAASAVPVEVVPFGWQSTQRRLADLGAAVTSRVAADGKLFVSDGGNVTIDCAFGAIDDPPALERSIRAIVGVIECGLFAGLASQVIVAEAAGIRRLLRP
jgi:ribose 5-phosphate isomerase A